MYVHISASPEKILRQNGFEKVSLNGTLIICTQKFKEKKREQENCCMEPNLLCKNP